MSNSFVHLSSGITNDGLFITRAAFILGNQNLGNQNPHFTMVLYICEISILGRRKKHIGIITIDFLFKILTSKIIIRRNDQVSHIWIMRLTFRTSLDEPSTVRQSVTKLLLLPINK